MVISLLYSSLLIVILSLGACLYIYLFRKTRGHRTVFNIRYWQTHLVQIFL